MYILAIDQGTTGTTTVLYGKDGKPVKKAYREFTQHFPQPGWVEHDPEEIWQTVVDTVTEICTEYAGNISAVGITNQRETTVVWNKKTGKPVHNAIVWQCRRTAGLCEELKKDQDLITAKTGLPVDAYFSGTKLKWILENVKDLPIDDLLFGTIDTWLVWKLTRGKVHATDHTNASRTLLFNIEKRRWDDRLCQLLSVPPSLLPEVKNSADDYGTVTAIEGLKDVPISGVAGDQQAALFGQACFEPGQIKNTYGTGCFLMMNTGTNRINSANGLLSTLAIDAEGKPCCALEGSVFIAGAAIQWLRDELKILEKAPDSEAAANAVENTNGVYLVPAFVGLGAPYWDSDARGILTGLTRGTSRNHVIRAALESMAFQTSDVLNAMHQDTGSYPETLAVDGGACANNFLMQFQADITGCTVCRPEVIESTSLGAAFLAGLYTGFWGSSDELARLKKYEKEFTPQLDEKTKKELLAGWEKAVRQARKK